MRTFALTVIGSGLLSAVSSFAIGGIEDAVLTYWLGVFAGSIFSATVFYVVLPDLGKSIGVGVSR